MRPPQAAALPGAALAPQPSPLPLPLLLHLLLLLLLPLVLGSMTMRPSPLALVSAVRKLARACREDSRSRGASLSAALLSAAAASPAGGVAERA